MVEFPKGSKPVTTTVLVIFNHTHILSCLSGALVGIRTPNLLIRSQMLYPLSYERLLLLTIAKV